MKSLFNVTSISSFLNSTFASVTLFFSVSFFVSSFSFSTSKESFRSFPFTDASFRNFFMSSLFILKVSASKFTFGILAVPIASFRLVFCFIISIMFRYMVSSLTNSCMYFSSFCPLASISMIMLNCRGFFVSEIKPPYSLIFAFSLSTVISISAE